MNILEEMIRKVPDMKLIVNGDDLGYTRGVTEGILEGYHRGILRSTTALMSSEYIKERNLKK